MAKMTGNVRGERLMNENGYDYERADFRRYIRDLC